MSGRLGIVTKRFVISYDDTPGSINHGGGGTRRHWSAARREKLKWEGIFYMLLLERRVPRGMSCARISILLEFKHRNRRDVENYRQPIVKPLADCMVRGGMLPDDTDEFFVVEFMQLKSGVDLVDPVKARTTITIDADYE